MEQTKPKLRFKNYDSGWKQKSLGEVGNILNGLTYSPGDISDNGKLVLRSSNIKKGLIDLNDSVYVETTSYNEVKENDILICVRNGSKRLIGKNCLIPKYLEGEAFGAFMIIYRSEHNKFIKQLLSSEKFYKQVHRNLGATINSINNSDITKFKFYYPTDINEQQKISSFLTSVDDKINLLIKKKELLEQYKKGVMQKIFSQEIRFQDDNGNDFPDWDYKKLDEILIESVEKSIKLNQYKVLSSSKSGLFSQDEYFKNQVASKNNIGYKILKKNQLVFSPQNLWLGNININSKYEAGIVSPSYKIFNFNKEVSVDFIRHIIKSPRLIYEYAQASEMGASVVRRNLNMDLFLSIKIMIPSYSEQIKIGLFLSSLDKKIELVNSQIDKTEDFKKGLLQQMFV